MNFRVFFHGAETLDRLCYLCLVFVMLLRMLCCLVVTCWERADHLAVVCDVQLCFCNFPMWYPGSGVVLDCIDS